MRGRDAGRMGPFLRLGRVSPEPLPFNFYPVKNVQDPFGEGNASGKKDFFSSPFLSLIVNKRCHLYD